EGMLTVPGSRKSNTRQLSLTASQMVALMEDVHEVRPTLLRLSGKDSDRLLVSVGSRQRLTTALQMQHEQLPTIHPAATSLKQLRASVNTHWLKTTNLRQAQHMAGHRYVSSTESYLVNDLEGLQEDVGRFHPLG